MSHAVDISQQAPSDELLRTYAEVPIAFTVRSRFHVEPVDRGLGGWTLTEERVEPPYEKDYDRYCDGDLVRWLRRWDISHWAVISATDGPTRVGGAVAGYNTPGAHMEEGRDDLAVLWDIRVRPERRGEGIGSRLFRRAAEWARQQGCERLKVETQNINVPACRFYPAQGCQLRAVHPNAYPELPHEVQLLWYLDL